MGMYAHICICKRHRMVQVCLKAINGVLMFISMFIQKFLTFLTKITKCLKQTFSLTSSTSHNQVTYNKYLYQ